MSKRDAKPEFEDINLDELDEVVGGCGGFNGFQGFQGFQGLPQGLAQQGGPANLQQLLASSPNGGAYQWSWDSFSGYHGSFTDGNGVTESFNGSGLSSAAPGGALPSGGGGGSGV